MNSKIIIIAILIMIKVIGIASHAKADFSKMDWYKDYKEQSEKEHREMVKQWEYKEFFEDTITITNIDDYSYIAEYLNGKKKYCITNDFEELGCVDYSLVSSSIINHESNKITNGKISKDEESEMKDKEELILSMTLSTLFNITQL